VRHSGADADKHVEGEDQLMFVPQLLCWCPAGAWLGSESSSAHRVAKATRLLVSHMRRS
jgi:hypothetical protein